MVITAILLGVFIAAAVVGSAVNFIEARRRSRTGWVGRPGRKK